MKTLFLLSATALTLSGCASITGSVAVTGDAGNPHAAVRHGQALTVIGFRPARSGFGASAAGGVFGLVATVGMIADGARKGASGNAEAYVMFRGYSVAKGGPDCQWGLIEVSMALMQDVRAGEQIASDIGSAPHHFHAVKNPDGSGSRPLPGDVCFERVHAELAALAKL